MIKSKNLYLQALNDFESEALLDNSFLDLELQEEEEFLNQFKEKEDLFENNY